MVVTGPVFELAAGSVVGCAIGAGPVAVLWFGIDTLLEVRVAFATFVKDFDGAEIAASWFLVHTEMPLALSDQYGLLLGQ